MSDRKPLELDLNTLDTVTGGASSRGSSTRGTAYCGGGSSNVLLNQLSSLADSVKDITNKTSGFSSSQFLLFAVLAMANRNNCGGGGGSVVYYASGPRRWW